MTYHFTYILIISYLSVPYNFYINNIYHSIPLGKGEGERERERERESRSLGRGGEEREERECGGERETSTN